MAKYVFSLWFGLCVLFSACVPQEIGKETIPSDMPTGTPSGVNLTPIPIIVLPVFVYLDGEVLMVQVGSNTPDQLIDLPELDSIKNAILVGDTIYLLREQGIQRIYLSEGKSDILLPFDTPMLAGGLIFAAGYSRIIYYSTDNWQESLVGYYDLDQDIVYPAFSFPQDLHPLGLTDDGQGLYCLPVGQDPEFNKVLLIDLEQGSISRELPVQGVSSAALAPDARLLATFAQRSDPSGQLESVINLYDLPSLPLTPPRVFTLPNAPSYVGFGGIHWSPDSQRLYFMLVENIYDAPATSSYGLWRLDVESGVTDQVAPISDPVFHTVSISPDGEWIVLMHETNDEAILINLRTGEVDSFSVPVNAIVAGWQ